MIPSIYGVNYQATINPSEVVVINQLNAIVGAHIVHLFVSRSKL